MAGVERALHQLYPELREEMRNASTNEIELVPVHVHAHRFRKALVTIAKDSGLTRDDVAKITTHRAARMIDEVYNKPSIAAKREAAGRFADALGGPREIVDGRDDVIVQLRAELAARDKKIDDLMAKIDKLIYRMGVGT